MLKVTLEQAIQNQVASAEMEGFTFTEEMIEIIRQYASGKISEQELIDIVRRLYAGDENDGSL